MKHRVISLALVAVAMVATANCAFAQGYPNKPIRMIVPFAAGGGVDFVARILAQKVGESIGQQIVVENRGGGGGSIGADIVAKAAPDGYTLGMISASHAVNPSLYAKLPFDSVKSFAPIMQTVSLPMVLVVHPSSTVRSVSDLIREAKAKPGTLSYASSGNGGLAHLAGELLKQSAKIDMVHIPYKGGGPAVTDVVGGQVPLLFNTIPPILQYVRSERLRPLAVTSAKRTSLLPDVPTFTEQNLPAVQLVEWHGIVAPAGTPAEVISRMNAEFSKALRSPDVVERLSAQGAEPVASSPEEFAGFLQGEITRWGIVVREAGIRAE